MNCLRQPGDSDYDVLGVSPDATDADIKDAFCQLIDEQGYKIGVPLRSQWARAREIKAAYATLGDPAKRRAYDQMLGRDPRSTPWPATATAGDTAEPSGDSPSPDGEVASGSDGSATAGSRKAWVPDSVLGSSAEDGVWFHDRPPPSYLAPKLIDDARVPTRGRAMVAAVGYLFKIKDRAQRFGPCFATPDVQVPIHVKVFMTADA